MRDYLHGTWILVLLSAYIPVVNSIVKLKADVIYIQNSNTTSAIFRCSAGQGYLFYLNNIITWSKVGRDGRERYLSINWDLVHDGASSGSGYVISSQMLNEGPQKNPKATPKMYFLLGKLELSPSDHGEYICRLHDFDRNVIAEHSVPIIVFDKGLALSPYRIVGEGQRDIAINCMHNTSVSSGSHIVLYHVTSDGISTRIVDGGKFVHRKLKMKYDFTTRDTGDRILHNILTLKAPVPSDNGHVVCEMRNAGGLITETTATLTIGAPKLKVYPPFFLKVPFDAIAHLKCECQIQDTAACINNDIVWSVINSTTGVETTIYKGGKLRVHSSLYEITTTHRGSSVNLTIHGLTTTPNGREYICSLHGKTTGTLLAKESIPVSVAPVRLGALSLIDNYPKTIRFLCTMSGSIWDNHYFDDHKLSWIHNKDGVSKKVSSNGELKKGYNSNKYSVQFDSQRYYTILAIKNKVRFIQKCILVRLVGILCCYCCSLTRCCAVARSDYGEYKCQLTNKHSGHLLFDETLQMYGKGNTTIFSAMKY